METIHPPYCKTILSNYPIKVTAGDILARLEKDDAEAKAYIIDFIFHRLHNRYLVPLSYIPKDFKSGFLMMASACLLIEAMQSFYEGLKDTRRQSEKAFVDFFKRQATLFPDFASEEVDFYHNIRCGILHQAETRGGYRILRKGPIIDPHPQRKTINADAFIKALERCLREYIRDLRNAENGDFLWANAKRKVRFICDNCKTEG